MAGCAFFVAGAPQVSGEAEMKSSGYLIVVEVGDLAAGIIGNHPLVNPSADLVEMPVARATGEFAEHVGPELAGVGTGDAAVFVDPYHRGHVADGVQLGEKVIGVHQHRIGDAIGQYPHFVYGLVNGHRDHLEAVIGHLVLQLLPPGQVEGASSPTGEGN